MCKTINLALTTVQIWELIYEIKQSHAFEMYKGKGHLINYLKHS
jgi:hypothetical protein